MSLWNHLHLDKGDNLHPQVSKGQGQEAIQGQAQEVTQGQAQEVNQDQVTLTDQSKDRGQELHKGQTVPEVPLGQGEVSVFCNQVTNK